MKIIAENRKARHDYHIIETFEAGLVLKGSEVKSLREQSVQLKDAYISFSGQEAFLQNAHIAVYKDSSYNNHHPERLRKLLLHKHELSKLWAAIREKGLTIIPLKLYFKDGRAKVEIAIAKGKKLHDKRESAKTRSVKREIQQRLRSSRG